MRIATWNVNSIRQRLDHLLTWLKECSPDVVCLQEIKCVAEAFPRLEIGVTIPIASTSTGMDLRSALASSTETIRGRCGPWALLLPPIHEERVTKPAAARMPTAPTKSIRLRFFIFFHARQS